MNFAYLCVFIAFLIPYVLTIIAKVGSANYDNNEPRPFMERLQGWRKRAYWAHLNGFEAFAPFAAAVIIAHQLQVSLTTINFLAALFILSRILHAIFYIVDRAALRSLVWFIGFLATIGLFTAAL